MGTPALQPQPPGGATRCCELLPRRLQRRRCVRTLGARLSGALAAFCTSTHTRGTLQLLSAFGTCSAVRPRLFPPARCVSPAFLTRSLQLTGPYVQRRYGHHQPDLVESEHSSATVVADTLGRRRYQPAAAAALSAYDAAAQPAAA
eukprot:scaffold61908_cov66-Phaeocystis_antarctica.AAC.3